ncbi:hypothetical protein AQUCO_11100015v1 [Aquilegia coerulea]|uniref:Uncharacterized protein n=1 Tax=Aquilegia coerulea TaxID=218851 RepID=A0A2G5C2P3_AQUCA|nr:hypothetical protein AQUCO_11100015v1 [Aquilegia coerulea]
MTTCFPLSQGNHLKTVRNTTFTWQNKPSKYLQYKSIESKSDLMLIVIFTETHVTNISHNIIMNRLIAHRVISMQVSIHAKTSDSQLEF